MNASKKEFYTGMGLMAGFLVVLVMMLNHNLQLAVLEMVSNY